MDINYIRKSIQEIEDEYSDESAHRLEDKLRKEFIEFISLEYEGDLKKMAEEVLKTNNMDFARWYS